MFFFLFFRADCIKFSGDCIETVFVGENAEELYVG